MREAPLRADAPAFSSWARRLAKRASAKRRKIRPRTGPEYSPALSPEFARNWSAAAQRRFSSVWLAVSQLWNGPGEGDERDLRRVDPRTGEVLERLEMPPGVNVSGLESDGADQFFCGGGKSGEGRAVRRAKRGSPGS